MKTFAVFLRGINVSGQKKILMAGLRLLLEKEGFIDVKTYIQSGNIVLSSQSSKAYIKKQIHALIKENYGFEVPVFVFAKSEIDKVISQNSLNDDLSKLYYTLIGDTILKTADEIKSTRATTEKFVIGDGVIYLYCPDGYGKTVYTNNYFEKKLDILATTRNHKTLRKIQSFLTASES